MLLAGKRIILTGGSTGIGRATALRVAKEGGKVAFFDVNDADAATTLQQIEGSGVEGRYWHVDIVDEEQVELAVDEALSWLGGKVDVLINVAGVPQGANVSIDEFPPVVNKKSRGTKKSFDIIAETTLTYCSPYKNFVQAAKRHEHDGHAGLRAKFVNP